jgi:metal-dependent hydrolase (beta-lactamase superfamily II)
MFRNCISTFPLSWLDSSLGISLITAEVTISHSHTPHSAGLLWKSNRPVAQTSLPDSTQKTQTSMPPAVFEPAIPASERLQTHALDGAVNSIGKMNFKLVYLDSKIML